MKKYKWIVVILNLLVLLFYFNYSIVKKEDILAQGQLILLELAPLDPRSLMQGDYMSLRYKIPAGINTDTISKRGYCVVQLAPNGAGQITRLQKNKLPLFNQEFLINYTKPEWQLNIGAESFFFQEGNSYKYAKAKYGGIKTDKDGNSLLSGLYNENLVRIE